nr:ABC transporter permease [Intestinimonas butyriciproducens]
MVNKDLQMKYRKSKLGVFWSVLTPFGLAVIIGSVYSIIFSSDPREFIPLIFAGLNPWIFMSSTADSGTLAFIGAEGYLKQTVVNAQIFPLRITLVNFINLLYALIAFLTIYLFLQPARFGPAMLLVLPGLCIMFVFALGLANLASSINLSLRDYQPMQSLIFQGLFYATPIIFSPSMLDEKGFSIVYRLNPFYYILELVKSPIQGFVVKDTATYGIALLIALAVFAVSVCVVMKAKKGIAFKL